MTEKQAIEDVTDRKSYIVVSSNKVVTIKRG